MVFGNVVYGDCRRVVDGFVGQIIGYEKEQIMFGGGYKKKKILKLAREYAIKRDLGWDVYYREMSGLLK